MLNLDRHTFVYEAANRRPLKAALIQLGKGRGECIAHRAPTEAALQRIVVETPSGVVGGKPILDQGEDFTRLPWRSRL